MPTETNDVPRKARPLLLWEGIKGSGREYQRWRNATSYRELREDARRDKQWTHVSWWDRTAERRRLDRARTTANVTLLILVALGGGWWPTIPACTWWVWWAYLAWSKAKTEEIQERERAGLRAAWTALGVAVSMFAVTALAGGVHFGPGVGNIALTGLVAAGLTVGYVSWIWDGTIADNLRRGDTEPARVDEVRPDITSNGGVVAALASPLRVTKASEIRDRFTIVGGGLAKDSTHRWKTVTIQMRGRTVRQVQQESVLSQVAGNLLIPADWLIIDEGSNASQVVLHMAESSPWPQTPTRAPVLDVLTGDVWAPQRVGTDLLGSVPVEAVLAASSIGIGGNTGTGKTALERLLGVMVLSDPYARLDVWDFKGDGALSMFDGHAGTYASGDVTDIGEDFLTFLRAVHRDMVARAKFLERLAGEDRAAVRDAKVTRDLARKHPQLRPRFVLVDEFQDPIRDRDVHDLLVKIARKGRSSGTRLILATQTWDARTIDTELSKVLPTRIALRMPDYSSSAQILGGKACRFRADLLPHVGGAAVLHPAGDGAAVAASQRVILDYADAVETHEALTRIRDRRGGPGSGLPACPPLLAAVHDLVVDSPTGRIRSLDLCGFLEQDGWLPGLSDGLDARARAQLLADRLRPYGVRPRPDRARNNALSYWVNRVDPRRGEDVGVAAARAGFGGVSPGGSTVGDDVGPVVDPVVGPRVVPLRKPGVGA